MERIKQIQSQFSFQFCDDYRRYLEEAPEGRTSSSELKARTGEFQNDATSFFEQVGAIYGLEYFEQLLQNAENGEINFWHTNLLKHAYPIGKSMLGDPIIQVAGGTYKGHVYMTNHEAWYGGFEHFALRNDDDFDELEELLEDYLDVDEIELRDLSTDQLVEILNIEDLDGNIFLADRFEDFYETTRQTHL